MAQNNILKMKYFYLFFNVININVSKDSRHLCLLFRLAKYKNTGMEDNLQSSVNECCWKL